MPQGPIPVQIQGLGGIKSALNITAASVAKSTNGYLYRVVVSAAVLPTGGSLTINDSNALVTAQTITGITQAASGVVTLSTGGGANPFSVGQTITFASIVGMTQLNGLVGTVTAIGGVTTAWTATFNINTTAFTAWASAGTAASFGVGNQIVTIPFGALTIGEVIPLEWPCLNGILVSAVPTGGTTPSYAIAYS